jgi:hypothetical protein
MGVKICRIPGLLPLMRMVGMAQVTSQILTGYELANLLEMY